MRPAVWRRCGCEQASQLVPNPAIGDLPESVLQVKLVPLLPIAQRGVDHHQHGPCHGCGQRPPGNGIRPSAVANRGGAHQPNTAKTLGW